MRVDPLWRMSMPGIGVGYSLDCIDDLIWNSFGETDILLLDFTFVTVYTVPALGHHNRTRTRTRIDIHIFDVAAWTFRCNIHSFCEKANGLELELPDERALETKPQKPVQNQLVL